MRYLHLALLCCLLSLNGCITMGLTPAEDTLSHGWRHVANEDYIDEPPLYCYRTIGQVDCYKEPVPERASTLVTEYPIKNKRPSSNLIWLFRPGYRSFKDPKHDLPPEEATFTTKPVPPHSSRGIQEHPLSHQHKAHHGHRSHTKSHTTHHKGHTKGHHHTSSRAHHAHTGKHPIAIH